MLKLWLVTPKLREEIALEAYLKMMARNYMGGDEVPKKQRIASKFAWDFIMII